MQCHQVSILAPTPRAGRFLTFSLAPNISAAQALSRVETLSVTDNLVLGIGAPLVSALGRPLDGLRPFPALVGPGVSPPSTQGALWLSLGSEDPGAILQQAREITEHLSDSFLLVEDVASFLYAGGRDLSGYEDGTENPKAERAREVAIASLGDIGLDGGSFVAVQRWVHDLSLLSRMPRQERDHMIGRHQGSNEEIKEAPDSAHVKRSAQESFDPEAFMLRRSMPWGDVSAQGLYFVAYAASLDPFERVLRRMLGLEDGIVDALFRFSRPVTGAYYWCPPSIAGRLELRALRS